MKIDIIKNYFLILIFTIYGLMSIILVCRVFSKEGLRKNKLIEQILNDSSEEDDSKDDSSNVQTNPNNSEVKTE